MEANTGERWQTVTNNGKRWQTLAKAFITDTVNNSTLSRISWITHNRSDRTTLNVSEWLFGSFT